jgi:serine/threonine-protein kinase
MSGTEHRPRPGDIVAGKDPVTEHRLRPGDVVAGKYRVERVLGEGGMGLVVAAHHMQLDERVALKVLLAKTPGEEGIARFEREARAAVKIKSEHVARVSDVGQLDDGTPYMVMEYLEGVDLAGWLKQRGPLPVDLAVDFTLQACEALAEAHAMGIVHRDLKPGNLFCVQRAGAPSIKVLDFGISKFTTPGKHDMTRTDHVFGSPQYMSPEQLRSAKDVDPRADIWSMGAILFELVTGRAPFLAQSITELAFMIANVPTPYVGDLRSGVAHGLEQVIARCLEKDRTKRFQNVGELAVSLEHFGSPKARSSVERVLGSLRKTESPVGFVKTAPMDAARNESSKTEAQWGHTGSGLSGGTKARSIMYVLAASLVVVLLVGVGGLLSARTTSSGSAGAKDAPVATALPPAVSPLPTLSPLPDTSPTPSASASAPPPVESVAPLSEPPAPSAHRPPAIHAVPPPAPKHVDCDPPYTVNEKGSRVFKKECL